jgi:hypothetical protein
VLSWPRLAGTPREVGRVALRHAPGAATDPHSVDDTVCGREWLPPTRGHAPNELENGASLHPDSHLLRHTRWDRDA